MFTLSLMMASASAGESPDFFLRRGATACPTPLVVPYCPPIVHPCQPIIHPILPLPHYSYSYSYTICYTYHFHCCGNWSSTMPLIVPNGPSVPVSGR